MNVETAYQDRKGNFKLKRLCSGMLSPWEHRQLTQDIAEPSSEAESSSEEEQKPS